MELFGVPFKPVEQGSPEFGIAPEFQDLAIQSRQKQRLEPNETISQKFSNILSSKTMQEIQSKGVLSIGNVNLTPNVINRANQDVKFRTNLYKNFSESQNKTKTFQDPDMPVVSFSTADYENIDDSIFEGFDKTTPAFQDLVKFTKNRQKIAKVFGKDSLIPLKGRQLIIDEFETGNMYNELANMVKSMPGDFLRIPNLAYMGYAAVRSGIYGISEQEEGATGNKFAAMMADTRINCVQFKFKQSRFS